MNYLVAWKKYSISHTISCIIILQYIIDTICCFSSLNRLKTFEMKLLNSSLNKKLTDHANKQNKPDVSFISTITNKKLINTVFIFSYYCSDYSKNNIENSINFQQSIYLHAQQTLSPFQISADCVTETMCCLHSKKGTFMTNEGLQPTLNFFSERRGSV